MWKVDYPFYLYKILESQEFERMKNFKNLKTFSMIHWSLFVTSTSNAHWEHLATFTICILDKDSLQEQAEGVSGNWVLAHQKFYY